MNSHTLSDQENKKTILVADDEEFNFLYISCILCPLNVKVIYAANGKEAVDVMMAGENIDTDGYQYAGNGWSNCH